MTKRKLAKEETPMTVVAEDTEEEERQSEGYRRLAIRPLEQHHRQSGVADAVVGQLR